MKPLSLKIKPLTRKIKSFVGCSLLNLWAVVDQLLTARMFCMNFPVFKTSIRSCPIRDQVGDGGVSVGEVKVADRRLSGRFSYTNACIIF